MTAKKKTGDLTVLKEPSDNEVVSTFRIAPEENSRELISDRCAKWLTMGTLIYVNLINYMDRYAVSAVLQELQNEFNVTNDKAGLLQTGFLLSYMTVGPLFGFLGDRYDRKVIIASGVLLWNLASLLSSFMESYWSFFAVRMVVGVGESGFSTIAPTIIGDSFKDHRRSQMLGAFYIAMPVGCGLGYITGSEMTKVGNSWRWGLRLSPCFGIVGAAMILFLVDTPVRESVHQNGNAKPSPWTEDILYLLKNRSFIYATVATTCVFYVAGALAWWGPVFILKGFKLQTDISKPVLENSIFIFGITMITSGMFGLALGCYLSQKLRKKFPTIDPLICSIGLLLSTPFLVGALYAATYDASLFFVAMFLGEFFFNLNCSVVNDILLYVTIPSRRSGAEGIYLLITHTFGDAGSPYLVGILSEVFNRSFEKNEWNEYKSLQYSLLLMCTINLIGAFFFFVVSLHLLKDKHLADSGTQETR